MIRKDKLPNPWGDDWHLDTQPTVLDIPQGSHLQIIACTDQWVVDKLNTPQTTENGKLLTPNSELLTQNSNLTLNIGPNAHVELCRLQGIDTPAEHLTQLRADMQQGATLSLATITLGGTHVRNNIEVRMHGENCRLQAGGLYLVDRQQRCDNYIFVEHAAPSCFSTELYKGILDDAAQARFNGHVLVQDGATKTEAFQTNRNVLLTDKAHVDTRPFLEIYNDDVKCSHGSTIGQLDQQALFYLQTRGISLRTAITMLSYAFCDEVIRMIEIPALRDIVGDMVKKRLHGELTPCDECSIRCSTPCNGLDANFDIDPHKL